MGGKKVQLRVLIHTVGVLNAEREHVGNRGRRKTDSMIDNHGILRKIGRRGVIKRRSSVQSAHPRIPSSGNTAFAS